VNSLVDARGLKCPLPALKAEKAAARLKPGDILTVLATDPMAKIDIPHFCAGHGLDCTSGSEDGALRFQITLKDQDVNS